MESLQTCYAARWLAGRSGMPKVSISADFDPSWLQKGRHPYNECAARAIVAQLSGADIVRLPRLAGVETGGSAITPAN